MISIKVKWDSKSVKDYFKEHLETGEYYSEKGKHDGVWHGKGLEHFEIAGGSQVEAKEFDSFSDGLNPVTGARLTARQKDKRRSCYDMVFSAPKSLSIMALLARDERLIAAHHEALNRAFIEVEKRAQARIRKGHSVNGDENRFTGNLVSCRFTHRSSRALDPQLHTHCVVFNVTYDPVEKRMKALQSEEIYAASQFITAVYRNDLAARVRKLGYEIEEARHGWRIKGLPKEIETLFSKRGEFIQELKAKVESKTGATLDNNAISHLALVSRAEKNHELTDEDLLKLQEEQMTEHQLKMLGLLKEAALSRAPLEVMSTESKGKEGRDQSLEKPVFSPSEIAASKEAIRYAIDHVFARKSVVKQEELLSAALARSAGRASLESILEELKSDDFVKIGNFIMTREEEKRESEILEMICSSQDTGQSLGDSSKLVRPLDQKYEQQYLASKLLLESKSQFLYLRGKAGVGKTYTLKQLIENVSLPVILSAPTSSATDTLRQEVSGNAMTVQKLLFNENEQEALKNSLLVVDEAGFLSTQEMHALLNLALKHNTKILFVGDTRQHASVAAGDALRLIENHSPIPIAEISTITRQKEAKYLEAVQALSQGDSAKGLDLLQKMGAVRSLMEDGSSLIHDPRAQAVALEYISKTQEGLSTLVVTPTWAEHERVTHAIRSRLKENGTLSRDEVKLKVYQSLNFTQIEKAYAPNFEQGAFLSFHAKHGKFRKGEIWEVTHHEKGQIFIKNDKGKERIIHPKKYARSFDVVKAEERAFAAGDLILFKANYRGPDQNILPNGTIKKVERLDSDGTLYLDGGIKLDPNFRNFLHGYAITSQGSQGKTRDYVIVSADACAAHSLSKNQLYVSVSRGIRGVTIFTNDFKKFREAVSKTSDRKLITEEKEKTLRSDKMSKIFQEKLEKLGYSSAKAKEGLPAKDRKTQFPKAALQQEIQKRRQKETKQRSREIEK